MLAAMLTMNTRNTVSVASASEIENIEDVHADCLHHQNESQNEQESQSMGIMPLSNKPKHPASGSRWADDGTVTNRTLIPNSNYFTTAPRHGENTGTCGPIAAQLMLSYHNYYSDRRIIAPQHLHGGWNSGGNGDRFDATNYTNAPESPNACVNPASMTSWTLGSNQAYHDFIEDEYIDGGGTIIELEWGMDDLLDDRNDALGGVLNYNTWHHHALGIFKIGTSGPMGELNAGRPVILGMYEMLGGIDHYVVAYGYQHLDGEFGYIVHYGWDEYGTTNHTFRWIDADWVNSYSAMTVTHTHNYTIDTGINRDGNTTREFRCACGHRTTQSLFNVSGRTVTGARYQLTGSITIPSTINGTTITAIGNSAFFNQTQISQITIPDSVTSIGQEAFANCQSLKEFTIPKRVTDIGAYIFWGCDSLEKITLPYLKRNIGYFFGTTVFEGQNSYLPRGLKSVVITDGKVGDHVFYGCANLTSITLLEGCTEIGIGAFEDCTGLTSFVIPQTVTKIGSLAFDGSNNLTKMTIPFVGESSASGGKFWHLFGGNSSIPTSLKTVTVTGGNIENQAFYGANTLARINLISPDLISIGEQAFVGCSSLINIDIQSSKLIRIEDSAFLNCKNLTSVNLPSSLKYIESYSFYNCTSLLNIVLPDSLINIGRYAFYNCTSLTNITLPGKVGIDSFAFYDCINLNVTIPNNITSIGAFAFENTKTWNNFADNSIVYINKWAVGIKGELTGGVSLNIDTKGIASGLCGSGITSIVIPKGIIISGYVGSSNKLTIYMVFIMQNGKTIIHSLAPVQVFLTAILEQV